METNDLLSLLIAAYKDKIERESLDRVNAELNALIVADADARRETRAADIREMAKLRMALTRFENSYSRLKHSYGDIEAVECYLASIRRRIKEISYKKNH